MVLMVATYVMIVYFAISIKKFLSNTTMSQKTKRLNSDMNKVLLALVKVFS